MSNELTEVMPFEYQIVESANGRFRVEGVFQRSDVENANKRVYPRAIWEKELKESRIREAIDSRSMYGELDHPSDGKTSLKRVSHIITGLDLKEDGVVTGGAEILNTPNGQILRELFNSGTQVGISSRGSGSVQNGRVQEDFKLTTFDFVARPSTPGAVPRPMGETTRSKSKFFEDDEKLDTMSDVSTDDAEFASFLDTLDTLDLSGLELDEDLDFNTLAHDVIELHNIVMESEITPEFINDVSGYLLALGATLNEVAVTHPEYGSVVADLLEKVEQTQGAIIGGSTNTQLTEEENMDKLDFIKARLNEATVSEEEQMQEAAADLYDQLNTLSDEELVDLADIVDGDRLREQLETLDDDELIEAGIEAGVIDPDDLEEGDDDEELDVQDLYDYALDLEAQLEEAGGVIQELVERLEESDDAETAIVKYEAALGIIQETVGRFQLLAEAVGGEEKATELMEAYITHLESQNDNYDNNVTESYNAVEHVLFEDSTNNPKMAETLRLVEGALSRLGAN